MCVVRDQPDGTYTCLACRVLGMPVRECTHRQSLGVCRNRANHRCVDPSLPIYLPARVLRRVGLLAHLVADTRPDRSQAHTVVCLQV
jgi:hypothetical protein